MTLSRLSGNVQKKLTDFFDMFVYVDRQEIIAALDAEIARLQHARALIAQAMAPVRPNGRQRPTFRSAEPNERVPSARGTRRLVRPRTGQSRPQTHEETTALVVRVPAKEAPKHRSFTAVPKQRTALTGDVPRGPVAAPKKTDRDMLRASPGSTEKFAAFTHEPASAFGEAISRSLAGVNS